MNSLSDLVCIKCQKAIKFGIRIKTDAQGLIFKDDCWQVKDSECSPLEAILLGEEELTGNFEQDLEKVLGCKIDIKSFDLGMHIQELFGRTT